MPIRNLPILFLLACTLQAHAPEADPQGGAPNIVLIFMDDLGYGDLSCYGALDIRTPNLDRMASEGIRFTNFLTAQAVCSASRAGLLTGCYPNRIGISGALFPHAKVGISPDETTLAEMLRGRGYATGIFGKWHLGDAPEFLPLQHGFDEYLGIPYSNDMWPVDFSGKPVEAPHRKSQFPPLPVVRNDEVVDTIADLEGQGTLTGRWTDAAIDFIRRNRRKPFFAYIPHSMPHVPINASPAFRGKSRQGMYGDVIQEVDHHVGRILETLRALRLERNTLVIFTSDNGPWLNFGNHAGNAGGFREGKGTSFEGGHRVPCLMRWKGTMPAGLVANQLSSTIDILPTLAGITGAKLPEKKIDGVDIGTILKGDMTATPRRTFNYYYRNNSLEAVRRDHWKLVFAHPSRSYLGQTPGVDGFPGPSPENVPMREALYDLRRDPGEQYDVSARHPEVLSELRAHADEVRKELGDELQRVTGRGNREVGRLR
jgi:arylsulfatase